MNQMRDPKLSSEMDELRGDLNKLREDLRTMADTVIGRSREQARHAQEQMQTGWDQSMHTFQKQVEERPVTTMAAAFMAGVILGRLLGK